VPSFCSAILRSDKYPDARRCLQHAMPTSGPQKSGSATLGLCTFYHRRAGQFLCLRRGARVRLPGQKVSSTTAISEWFCLESQAGVSNRRSVKKNRRFYDFCRRPCRLRAAVGGRVERWRGGLGGAYPLPALSSAGASLASPCSVSTSRSSNRTCGFLASGFRTRRSCVRSREVTFYPTKSDK